MLIIIWDSYLFSISYDGLKLGKEPCVFDVTPTTPWLTPAVEVDLKWVDGIHLPLVYHQGAPQLGDPVRAFMEPLHAPAKPPKSDFHRHRAG